MPTFFKELCGRSRNVMKPSNPGIYLFKVNNGNHRTMCKICSKLTNKETTWAVIRTFISLQFVYWLWLFPRGRLSNRINSTDEAAFTIVCYIIIHLLRTQNFPIIFYFLPPDTHTYGYFVYVPNERSLRLYYTFYGKTKKAQLFWFIHFMPRSLSILPENIRKPLVFCFQGV